LPGRIVRKGAPNLVGEFQFVRFIIVQLSSLKVDADLRFSRATLWISSDESKNHLPLCFQKPT
jgi:hypothetical protein